MQCTHAFEFAATVVGVACVRQAIEGRIDSASGVVEICRRVESTICNVLVNFSYAHPSILAQARRSASQPGPTIMAQPASGKFFNSGPDKKCLVALHWFTTSKFILCKEYAT